MRLAMLKAEDSAAYTVGSIPGKSAGIQVSAPRRKYPIKWVTGSFSFLSFQ